LNIDPLRAEEKGGKSQPKSITPLSDLEGEEQLTRKPLEIVGSRIKPMLCKNGGKCSKGLKLVRRGLGQWDPSIAIDAKKLQQR